LPWDLPEPVRGEQLTEIRRRFASRNSSEIRTLTCGHPKKAQPKHGWALARPARYTGYAAALVKSFTKIMVSAVSENNSSAVNVRIERKLRL
jgi:hypothetical protein